MTIGSRARDNIDSYPLTAQNYVKVVDSPKKRFGRKEILAEYYVRELLSLIVKNATNLNSKLNKMQLYDKLESHLRSLESIDVTTDKYATALFQLVKSCIPGNLLRIWLRNPVVKKEEDKNSCGDKLLQLLLFLRAEVEGGKKDFVGKSWLQIQGSSESK
ncbi:hypothetical protein AVEN_244127-1 [Araneus ventricosus]|uniref:Uncharacterized protein n=1 Tax=Araneus ventricosus TaxID=182803 RepID=A0A4Y2T2X4_ARAVE|nr:hypothetical protein AVEN_244127-1 [Araneus ventricosus]